MNKILLTLYYYDYRKTTKKEGGTPISFWDYMKLVWGNYEKR